MAHTLAPALTRLTANIGVEVHGLDLGRGLDDHVLGLLRTAVAEHHVVVVRDQHLSADQHAAVAIAFGPILSSPVQMATGARTGAGSTIEDTASRPPAGFPWHTDLSWTARPPAFGFLSAVTIPEFGGDTIWASTAATFDALPPDGASSASGRRCSTRRTRPCSRRSNGTTAGRWPSDSGEITRASNTRSSRRTRSPAAAVCSSRRCTHADRRSAGHRRPRVERAELDARRPACPGAVEVG